VEVERNAWGGEDGGFATLSSGRFREQLQSRQCLGDEREMLISRPQFDFVHHCHCCDDRIGEWDSNATPPQCSEIVSDLVPNCFRQRERLKKIERRDQFGAVAGVSCSV